MYLLINIFLCLINLYVGLHGKIDFFNIFVAVFILGIILLQRRY